MLFGFGDFLVDAVAFFLRIFGSEGFAVAGDEAVDADAVDGEALGVGGEGLFEAAVAVELLLLEVDVVGVVAVGELGGALVALGVEEQVLRGGGGFLGGWGGRWLLGVREGGEEKHEEGEAATGHAAIVPRCESRAARGEDDRGGIIEVWVRLGMSIRRI